MSIKGSGNESLNAHVNQSVPFQISLDSKKLTLETFKKGIWRILIERRKFVLQSGMIYMYTRKFHFWFKIVKVICLLQLGHWGVKQIDLWAFCRWHYLHSTKFTSKVGLICGKHVAFNKVPSRDSQKLESEPELSRYWTVCNWGSFRNACTRFEGSGYCSLSLQT